MRTWQLTVACRDVGVDCDFKGNGETEEQLMNNGRSSKTTSIKPVVESTRTLARYATCHLFH